MENIKNEYPYNENFYKESVSRGLEFLSNNQETIVIRLPGDAWNFAFGQVGLAMELNEFIDKDGKNSGASFGRVLADVVKRAEEELGYKIVKTIDGKDTVLTLSK